MFVCYYSHLFYAIGSLRCVELIFAKNIAFIVINCYDGIYLLYNIYIIYYYLLLLTIESIPTNRRTKLIG